MECYGLDRFSEDIDLDSEHKGLIQIVDDFCEKQHFTYRVDKDTDTVERCFVDYGGKKPLKIEASFRRKKIPISEITNINGICVYTLKTIALQKCNAYMDRDRIRDLYDITFICKNFYDDLPSVHKQILQNALQYKGLEQFDFLVSNLNRDELIDVDKLADDFLAVYDKLGLLYTEEELKNFTDREAEEEER